MNRSCTVTLCRCCADNFSLGNPQSLTNPNICERCDRLSFELAMASAGPFNIHPEGRWTEKKEKV